LISATENLWRWGLVIDVLTADVLQELQQYHHIYVGYSGGLDSSVLLHALSGQAKFRQRVTAVHVNHGLSPQAAKWVKHCKGYCSELKIPLIVKCANLKPRANIEEVARNARYDIFKSLLLRGECLVLAHHLNDQAETLLLQLLRGTGVDGLAAMVKTKPFAQGTLLRPLLQHSRSSLEGYAKYYQLTWVEDESNENIEFSRNFLRQEILPQLRLRWPKVITNLVQASEHCRQAQSNLDDLAVIDCPQLHHPSGQLKLTRDLTALPSARLSNILRYWLKSNRIGVPSTKTFNRLITELIHAKPDANPKVSWGKYCIRRYQDVLYLVKDSLDSLPSCLEWTSFPKPLKIDTLGSLYAVASKGGLKVTTGSQVIVRFRQGGENFIWKRQTKQLKKLFQDWQIPPWLRNHIPLVYIDNQLACIVGYAISDEFFQPDKGYEIQLKRE
jgi:tRNA(Ile)-lysidine synthase